MTISTGGGAFEGRGDNDCGKQDQRAADERGGAERFV